MALIESPVELGPAIEVDRAFSAGRISLRPLDYQAPTGRKMGHYRMSVKSGTLTGTGITGGGALFSMRWPQPEGVAVISMLEAFFVPTAVFTAAQELGVNFSITRGTNISATGGTSIVLTSTVIANSNKCRSSMSPSLFSTGMIASTTILGSVTGGSEGNGGVYSGSVVNVVNAAKGTAFVNYSVGSPIPFGFRWEADAFKGIHPIILHVNEAIIVSNSIGFPAAGSAVLTVNMAWAEVGNY